VRMIYSTIQTGAFLIIHYRREYHRFVEKSRSFAELIVIARSEVERGSEAIQSIII
jgi:hypothetical protein